MNVMCVPIADRPMPATNITRSRLRPMAGDYYPRLSPFRSAGGFRGDGAFVHTVRARLDTPAEDLLGMDTDDLWAVVVAARVLLAKGLGVAADLDSPNRPRLQRGDVVDHERHPIVQSFEPGENWRWCYFDESYV